MAALGRGLASLIPKFNKEKAKEMLDQIDSMEFVEGEEASQAPAPVAAETVPQRKVSVVEEFEDVAVEEDIPAPVKPLVTPLTFDEKAASAAAPEEEVVAEEEVPQPEEETEEEREEDPAPEIAQVPPAPTVEVEKEDTAEEDIRFSEELAARTRATFKEREYRPSFGDGGTASGSSMWDKHEEKVVHIPVAEIHINPFQPRRIFDVQELEDLTQSIQQHGILQPLVVRRDEDGYELIAGERRLRAARKLNWDKVPCVVRRDVTSKQSSLVFALIENIQRENLNPVEEAMAYKQLNEEFGLTHDEIGERMGKSRVAISNAVRILQLPAEIQRGMSEGKITMGHARAILMIPDEEKQIRFYHHLLDEGLTVRKAETRARRIQRTMKINDPMRRKTHGRHALALQYSPKLEERYGHDAYIKFIAEKNRFEIVFKAYNEKEVHDLVGQLLGTVEHTDRDADVIDPE